MASGSGSIGCRSRLGAMPGEDNSKLKSVSKWVVLLRVPQ